MVRTPMRATVCALRTDGRFERCVVRIRRAWPVSCRCPAAVALSRPFSRMCRNTTLFRSELSALMRLEPASVAPTDVPRKLRPRCFGHIDRQQSRQTRGGDKTRRKNDQIPGKGQRESVGAPADVPPHGPGIHTGEQPSFGLQSRDEDSFGRKGTGTFFGPTMLRDQPSVGARPGPRPTFGRCRSQSPPAGTPGETRSLC